MGRRVNLLQTLPPTQRRLDERRQRKTEEVIRIAKQFGDMYFDGPRAYGYGGYKYDGRWIPVARDIIDYFSLKAGDRVLDVGCAKGYLLKDMIETQEGLVAIGLDVSSYALCHASPEVKSRVCLGSAEYLPFPDKSFAAAISLDTIHNLNRERARVALSELQRVSGGRAFVRLDSYTSPDQKKIFEDWVLTAEFHDYPSGWLTLFSEAGYTGDYDWTIID